MKIAYFINQYPQVSHSFIRREILALERQGFEVLRVALRGWDGPLPDEEDQRERRKTRHVLRGLPFGLVPAALRTLVRSPTRFFSALCLAVRMSRGSVRPLHYHLIYLAEACRLVQWLIGFGAERLHAHFGTNSAEIAMLARILGGPPYSFTVHGPEEFTRPMGLDEKVRRAAFVVAISDFGRSQLYMRSQYTDWPKLKVVHCGVERAFYEDVALPPVPSAPRLVCIGRLCAQKGQLLLIEAAARLAARSVAFELVLAGDGPMRGKRGVDPASWPGGARAHHRMDQQCRRSQGNPGLARDGPAELRGRVAGGDHGSHGSQAPGVVHLCRRHPGAGAPG